jgi:hypothetical protein
VSEEPRAFTPEEVRTKLLDHIHALVRYWNNVDRDTEGKLSGLAFSILSALDGCSMDLPAFLVTPQPHPDDKKYRQGEGRNWYPEDMPDLGMLHEHFHKRPSNAGS